MFKSNLRILFSLICTAIYLLILPDIKIGIIIILTIVILVGSTMNKVTAGVYFLLVGLPLLGLLFQIIGIYNLGSLFGLLFGIMLIINKDHFVIKYKPILTQAVIYTILFIIILLSFYYYGPQTEYCVHKLLFTIFNLIIMLIALFCIFNDYEINIWKLGVMVILSSILYYSGMIMLVPEIKPSNIFITAGLRELVFSKNYLNIVSLTDVGSICDIGIILIISSLINKKLSKKIILQSILAILLGFIILNSVGERLFIIIPFLALCSVIFIKSGNNKYIKILFSIMIIGFIIIIWYGIINNNSIISSIISSDNNYSQKVNRAMNWNAAIKLILEKPMFGHGLGGYYLKGYDKPGSGSYPHNLILELLTETGIIGTLILIIPITIFIIKNIKYIKRFRTATGCTIIPIFVLFFFHSMISHDLTRSSSLFAFFIINMMLITNQTKRLIIN